MQKNLPRLRPALLFCVLTGLCIPCVSGQAPQTAAPTLTVRSTDVLAPVLVKSKRGEVLLKLTAADFALVDNGVPQDVTLVQDTDSQPLALAIVVETGGAGTGHLADYRQIDAALDALIGGVEHRVALIGFDSEPHLFTPFTEGTAMASNQLASLREGDQGGAILDGVEFALQQLRSQPARYRRAILLISETIDHGSKTTLGEALRLINDTNTIVYSFGFSSTKSAVAHEAKKFGTVGVYGGQFGSSEPGPAHGCFSRQGADAEYEGHYSKQVLDCISQLAPPLRLATMSFLAARNALRTNAAEAVAQLTGGEYFHFHNVKDLKQGLIAVSNDVPNYYVLSFHPSSLDPGIHALRIKLLSYPNAILKSRTEYWIDEDTAR